MNILTKLTIKNLKLNKKRAVGTIIGIVLSVALICALNGLVTSFQNTLVQNAINERGYYHIALENISKSELKRLELNKDIENIHKQYLLGYSYFDLGDEEYPYIKVSSLEKDDFNNLSYQVVEGRLPKNSNEIVISKSVALKSNHKVGDTITLNIGNRQTSDGYELDDDNPYNEGNNEVLTNTKSRTYKIVGVVYRERQSNVFYGITTNENSNKISAYISLKNPRDYKDSFVEILNANSYADVEHNAIENINYEYVINTELLRWEAFSFSDSTVKMLIAIAAVLIFIIIFTSVFCIRNSFAISTTEKMKMYGMLSSVGATKKQIKRSVITEGFILGLIAIPIGILFGILAVFILVKIVNLLLGDFLFNNVDGICFKISLLPVLLSIILGFVTIYFSAISSAKKASKVSPIDNLRSSNEIKIDSKKLHTPKIITKLFKTGGTIAYKNLKRSKKKYRTTVISLTVSIFVFISMFYFVNEGFEQAGMYYKDYAYNIVVYNGLTNYDDSKINKLRNLDNINSSYMLYENKSIMEIKDKSKINHYEDAGLSEDSIYITLMALDDNSFKEYTKRLGIKYEEAKGKSILIDELKYQSFTDQKIKIVKRYNYKTGDKVTIEYGQSNQDTTNKLSLVLADVTNIRPIGLENTYYGNGILIVNKEYYKNTELAPYKLMIDTDNPETLVKDIETLDSELVINNFDEQAKAERAIVIVMSIFLYGFIGVITLIGVTNIFNTITSNMELRQKEFAMLKSIGMTKKEFNRMINLETLFYCSKSLIYGIILGILGSYAVHQAFDLKTEMTFALPYKGILISIVFVFVIVYIIMKYSISKINKQNTIETIRNENV